MKRLLCAMFISTALLPFLAAAQNGVVVLDTRSSWRMFSVLKPPEVRYETGVAPVSFKIAWLDAETPPAPANWAAIDMDDSGWFRGPATESPNTPMLSRLYIRGKFTVDNPASAGSLTLLATFHGGIIVYLNGAEIGRSHVPGSAKGDILAEDYPREAFIDDAGMFVAPAVALAKLPQPSEENKRRMGLWERSASIDLPARGLRKGMNVVGIEVVGAPQDGVVNDAKGAKGGKMFPTDFYGPTCHVLRLQLTAQGTSGLSINALRPEGIHVWNADILESVSDYDFANPAEPLRPVRIAGPRNGMFSGKVHVGSTGPIEGLSAVMSGLAGQGAVIPAAAVSIRYGVPWGTDTSYWPVNRSMIFCHGVSKTPLQRYPVGKANGKVPAGSVAPVWITVSIPGDAAPGTYGGVLTITTAGKTVPVPVALKVLPWTLPDSQDFRTWVDLIESPDTLAVEYNVPLWSERHFKMIGDSFELISGAGARIVYIPTLAHTNLGNEESMIRWIKKPGNQYDWDFSIMEKYLDLAQKNMGNPKIVVLQVWEVYMAAKAQNYRFEDFAKLGVPQVTFMDPVSKKTEFGRLPPLSDPGSKAVWKELIERVRAKLKERGLEKALMLGMFCDQQPSKEDIQFFASVAPDLEWVQQGHGMPQKVHGIANVGYNASVWGGYRFADGARQGNQVGEPTTEPLYGWSRPHLDAVFERNGGLDSYPATRWYFFPETAITGEMRGIGRIGADYWMAIRDKSGRRTAHVHDRYREGSWGGTSISLVVPDAVLSPGLEGPEATNRLIALIEGVQMAEARIYLEQAMKSGLSGDLKTRCETALKERLFNMWRALSNHYVASAWGNATMWRWVPGVSGHRYFLGSGWQDQSEKIFMLADEVRQVTGK